MLNNNKIECRYDMLCNFNQIKYFGEGGYLVMMCEKAWWLGGGKSGGIDELITYS